MTARLTLLSLCCFLAACGGRERVDSNKKAVRVAVIGGMTTTGLWQRISMQFESETGIPVELVVTGPKDALLPAFRDGRADLLTMHSSDEATSLVADGFAVNLRPWTRNEHVIMGPPADPAGIRGMRDGAAALRRIAGTRSPFLDARGGGRRMVSERLWERAGIRPGGSWVLKDESSSSTELLRYAESKGACVICGRIPVLTGKIPRGSMEILVEGDPDMQRPFVVIEANPARFPTANAAGAEKLADYLVSQRVQDWLRHFAQEQPAGAPLFYPLK
jgi:tungstate transport system substrate-binding protein